ncbi:hypothetical protein [Prevotella sp. 10(H)]|uniref:hypothetical protein n=1 Tax=Prevotella sp. 10(H) TaxID=1158294 RepID=UPI0018CBF650|nr:hypothetical protein [Prevotella sp. 10(H)]
MEQLFVLFAIGITIAYLLFISRIENAFYASARNINLYTPLRFIFHSFFRSYSITGAVLHACR